MSIINYDNIPIFIINIEIIHINSTATTINIVLTTSIIEDICQKYIHSMDRPLQELNEMSYVA